MPLHSWEKFIFGIDRSIDGRTRAQGTPISSRRKKFVSRSGSVVSNRGGISLTRLGEEGEEETTPRLTEGENDKDRGGGEEEKLVTASQKSRILGTFSSRATLSANSRENTTVSSLAFSLPSSFLPVFPLPRRPFFFPPLSLLFLFPDSFVSFSFSPAPK